MFIFGGRALGTLAGLLCAGVIAYALGGCADVPASSASRLVERIERPVDALCPAGTTRACVAHGPRRHDVRCGCEDARDVDAALARLTRQ